MTKPDFVRAKQKINEGRQWRGDVTVSLGDETVSFQHRLLTETEFMELQRALDTESLTDSEVSGNVGETEDQERLLELQQKSELTDAEEQELQELTEEVAAQTGTIERALGEEGYDLLMKYGKQTIEVSDEAVEYVYDLASEDPAQALDLMGLDSMPQALTKSDVREQLTEELKSMIVGQPYPIKLNVGLQAMSETMSVLGNGSHQ